MVPVLPILGGIAFVALLGAALSSSSSASAQTPLDGPTGPVPPLPGTAPSTPAPQPGLQAVAPIPGPAPLTGPPASILEASHALPPSTGPVNTVSMQAESELESLPPAQREGAEAALSGNHPNDVPAMRDAASVIAPTAPAVAAAIEQRANEVASTTSPDVPPSIVVSPNPVNLPPGTPAPVIEAAVDEQLGINNTQTVAPTPDINREQARNLAPLIASDVSSKRYSYSRARVRDFQRLVGLNPDGIYGPQTRQALIDSGVSNPPRALFN